MEALERRFMVEHVTSRENAEFSPQRQNTQQQVTAEVRKPYMFTVNYSTLGKRRNRERSPTPAA